MPDHPTELLLVPTNEMDRRMNQQHSKETNQGAAMADIGTFAGASNQGSSHAVGDDDEGPDLSAAGEEFSAAKK